MLLYYYRTRRSVRGRTAWLDGHATPSLPGQHALASKNVSNKATEFCESDLLPFHLKMDCLLF